MPLAYIKPANQAAAPNPFNTAHRMAEILDAVYDGLRHWIAGQLISMVVVGALFGIALSLIGVPAR